MITNLWQKDFKQTQFPDGHPHLRLKMSACETSLTWPIRNPTELFGLLQASEILQDLNIEKRKLIIPYLMAARFDRRMQPGDSFDLKIVADLINSCGWKEVFLVDVHSDVAMALINHSRNKRPLDAWPIPDDSVVIVPDAGAAKKVKRKNETVQCVKQRDPATGNIELTVLEPELCAGRNCVILDDICDGGATFIAIAEQIQPAHLTLAVTHGIFSKGFEQLNNHFDSVVTTDSFQSEAAMRSDPTFSNRPAPRNLIVIPLNL